MSPTEWHLKPNSSGPCETCGCPAKRLKARHRVRPDGRWEKRVSVCYGQDSGIEVYETPGWPAERPKRGLVFRV